MWFIDRLLSIFRKRKTQKTPEIQVSQVVVSTAPQSDRDAEYSDVIVHPLISEKASGLAGANQYVFVVRNDANRLQVSRAIKSMYGVSPLWINILNVRGKKVRFNRRKGSRCDWKKAVVAFPQGQTINVHEGV